MPLDEPEIQIDLGEARDQGPRPTCLSFSLSEVHRSAIDLTEPLSPESLHRRATQSALKSPNVGITIPEAAETLVKIGQTTEASWPYNADLPVGEICAYYKASVLVLNFSLTTILHTLKSGRPISLIIDVDMAFFVCSGIIAADLPSNSPVQGRHAVVICGIRISTKGNEFLIKNSWGAAWGNRGYAWLAEAYVIKQSPQLIQVS